MTRDGVLAYCAGMAGAVEEYPFGDEVAVFKVGGKMFPLVMLEGEPGFVNLKCDPDLALELRARYAAVEPGYHANKRHWNSVHLDRSIGDVELQEMIDHSYTLIVNRLPRAECREPGCGSVHPVKAASGAAPTKETIMGELQGIVRFTFHAGKVEEFKRLSAECLEIVRAKDVGTLQYDTYFNDDESECIVLERFRDSDALILHGQNMAPLMESIMATGTVSGELLGDLSEGLRAQMADSPVGLFTLYQAL